MHIYAASEQEAKNLENDLKDFMIHKYGQHIYPRAAALSNLLKQYGDSFIVNNFLK